MSYLIYVNGLGPNFRGDNIYELIFSDEIDLKQVWGESWESRPANGYPQPPNLKFINKIGILKNTDIKLELIQNSDYFSMIDAMDGVVALGWESDEIDDRLILRFGQSEEEVCDNLYSKDIILKVEKKDKYES